MTEELKNLTETFLDLIKRSRLEKISFSKEPSQIKNKYYKMFQDLPKKHSTTLSGTIEVFESSYLPPNAMMWQFQNPQDNKLFIFRENTVVELKIDNFNFMKIPGMTFTGIT